MSGSSGGPPKTKSGEYPEVQEYRKKLDSIREHTLPMLEEANRQAEQTRDEIRSMRPSEIPANTEENRAIAWALTVFFKALKTIVETKGCYK